MVGWIINAAKKSKYINRIIVSTESKNYARIAMKYGAEVPFLRKKELAKDSSNEIDFINSSRGIAFIYKEVFQNINLEDLINLPEFENLENIEFAAKSGVDRIELYTGPYADAYLSNPENAIASYVEAADLASKLGLGINAGHDLSLENLEFFDANNAGLMEVSIGHALISDALYFGLENSIQMYKKLLFEKGN